MDPSKPPDARRLPPAVWAFGVTSMFMDVSSELLQSLLPVFLATTLGVGLVAIGLIEGMAESTASISKVLSGALSDRWRRRKPLVVFGYALSALTKPIFPLATGVGAVAAARFVDRLGKGTRTAPRDALLADLAPPGLRGAAFGLRQALDSVGALLGPLLALLFMALLDNNIRAVLWVGVVFAFASVAVVAAAVPEPERAGGRPPFRFSDVRRLGRGYWLVVTLGAGVRLARFSQAFLVLRAQHAGASLAAVPLVMIVMNAVYAAVAYPAGSASDHHSRRRLLLAGILALIAADLVLAFAPSLPVVLAGAALWGLHMALTQAVLARYVADTAPEELRGSAFGIFDLIAGVAMLLASAIAGALWSAFGAPATFLTGAALAAAAAVGLAFQLGNASSRHA